jgi:hypothetical protein
MSRKCSLSLVLASWLCIAGCASKPRLPQLTADQLMEKHVVAVGGPALKQLQSWSIRTRVQSDNQSLGFINTSVRLPDHIRVDSRLGKSTSILTLAGDQGWTLGANGTSPMDADGITRLRVRASFDELLACQSAYCTPSTSGQEMVDSVPCYVLDLAWKAGYHTTVYLRSNDFLIAKVGSSITHKNRSIPIETFLSDYRRVAGVLVPFQTRVSGPYGSYTISVESFEVNPQLADSRFSVETLKAELGPQ